MGGMIFSAPFFGGRSYPAIVKIGLVFFTTLIIFPLIPSTVVYDVQTVYAFIIQIINELMIGLTIGLIMTFYLNFIYFAGDMIDRDLGFSMVNVVNPMDESQIPVTANFFYIFATLIFLQLNLHHQLIVALVSSFGSIPLGTSFFSVNSFPILIDLVVASFVIGFKIAAPFVITVVIANIVLGLLSKAMPGMNIFILGMPFKIFFGYLLFIILMPYFYDIFATILKEGFSYVQRFFILFGDIT